MTLTYKQIEDLENSMVAAQQVNLGQIVSYLSGSVTVSGSLIPAGAVSIVPVAGLNQIGFVTLAFSGSISGTNTYDTVSAGSIPISASGFAPNIIIKAWYLSGSVLTASSTGFTKVVWTAYGY